ncbi:hypothetical protein EV421DRAFT_1915793 [Armillaria borealis]|uniref:Uncharacterized protein n=1 Tax=Armillaria borealis TaxID=47425 RepID=A0AA39IEE7_9AGAR|nr:hypothetical protein EV421DRAFT_1915793 [Armillaria borealis]
MFKYEVGFGLTVIIPFIPTFLVSQLSSPSLFVSHISNLCPLVVLYLNGASPDVVRLVVDIAKLDGFGLVTGIGFLFGFLTSEFTMVYSNGHSQHAFEWFSFMQATPFPQDQKTRRFCEGGRQSNCPWLSIRLPALKTSCTVTKGGDKFVQGSVNRVLNVPKDTADGCESRQRSPPQMYNHSLPPLLNCSRNVCDDLYAAQPPVAVYQAVRVAHRKFLAVLLARKGRSVRHRVDSWRDGQKRVIGGLERVFKPQALALQFLVFASAGRRPLSSSSSLVFSLMTGVHIPWSVTAGTFEVLRSRLPCPPLTLRFEVPEGSWDGQCNTHLLVNSLAYPRPRVDGLDIYHASEDGAQAERRECGRREHYADSARGKLGGGEDRVRRSVHAGDNAEDLGMRAEGACSGRLT